MNALFISNKLSELTAAQLAALVNMRNPAYLAFVGNEVVYIQADGELSDGNTGDESGLPAERLAIRKVVVYAQADDKSTKVPLVVSYRIIGEVNETAAFRLIGQMSAKLVENANATGKSLLQTKVDIKQNADTQIAVYRMNGGGNYKLEAAAQYFNIDELTAIDAAMGTDANNHQLVIAGQKDGTAAITRFSPHTGQQIDASALIQLPKGTTEVKSVAVDRETLLLTMLVVSATKTEGFANASGTPETTKVNGLDGAESIRMTKTGLYAYDKKGEVKYFQRKGEGIDLTSSDIVLSGIDPNVFCLHDINVEDDTTTGRTKRTATFTARKAQTGGARQWTTQALAA